MIKRLFDLTVSLLALIALMPVLLILWVLIKLNSPGPVLFVQERVGLNGRVFRILKLRTMKHQPQNAGDYRTVLNDPRITTVGKLLRKTSLDELPQLINVLKGDMSIVGPRPDTPMQEARYEPWQWEQRLSVRPGITGLAQATRRSLATHEERFFLDLEYIRRQSFALDIWICLKTVGMLGGKGSN